MQQDDGGPAFPRPASALIHDEAESLDAQDGMTLRDYFAAKAMQAQMIVTTFSDATPKSAEAFKKGCDEHAEQHLAAIAYRIADAMLVERQR